MRLPLATYRTLTGRKPVDKWVALDRYLRREIAAFRKLLNTGHYSPLDTARYTKAIEELTFTRRKMKRLDEAEERRYSQ